MINNVSLPNTSVTNLHSNVRKSYRRLFARVYQSTTLRVLVIRSLKYLGIQHFQARSGINKPFICYLGDFIGEGPFVNAHVCRAEILCMAAWCEQFETPVIVDVGGNCGFVATQIALLLKSKHPLIFSFEPVPYTFKRLIHSVNSLKLDEYVFPVCMALSNEAGLARISYFESNTMLAQVFDGKPNKRVGDKIAVAGVLTLDQVAAVTGAPTLIKIDVEGHEAKVLEGARNMLSSDEAPAVCFELNPITLSESGASVSKLVSLLGDYEFFYIDDFEGQRIKFGEKLDDIRKVDWVCNIFAVPSTELSQKRWQTTLAKSEKALASLRN
jgi:FkbM family methyltransferase